MSGNLNDSKSIIARLNEDLKFVYTWTIENNLSIDGITSVLLPIFYRNVGTRLPPVLLKNVQLELVDKVKNLDFWLWPINRHRPKFHHPSDSNYHTLTTVVQYTVPLTLYQVVSFG